MIDTEKDFICQPLIYLFLYINIPSHVFPTLSESIFDFGKLMPVFYPIFHIAAIAADIADHRDLSDQGHRRGVDIVPAGVSARIVRHTHDIL